MPKKPPNKTTKAGSRFVASQTIDFRALFPTLLALLEHPMELQRPNIQGDLSEWIMMLRDNPLLLLGVDDNGGTHNKELMAEDGFWSQLCGMLIFPSQMISLKEHTRDCLNASDLERLGSALPVSDFEAAQSVLTDMISRGGPDGIRIEGVICLLRALETVLRCAAYYRASVISLIDQAKAGKESAVLKLIALDKMFLQDNCTKKFLMDHAFCHDRKFEARLAQALKRKLVMDKRGKAPFRLCLFGILALRLKYSSKQLQWRMDPQGTAFKTTGAFDKFVERCRRDFDRFERGL